MRLRTIAISHLIYSLEHITSHLFIRAKRYCNHGLITEKFRRNLCFLSQAIFIREKKLNILKCFIVIIVKKGTLYMDNLITTIFNTHLVYILFITKDTFFHVNIVTFDCSLFLYSMCLR